MFGFVVKFSGCSELVYHRLHFALPKQIHFLFLVTIQCKKSLSSLSFYQNFACCFLHLYLCGSCHLMKTKQNCLFELRSAFMLFLRLRSIMLVFTFFKLFLTLKFFKLLKSFTTGFFGQDMIAISLCKYLK